MQILDKLASLAAEIVEQGTRHADDVEVRIVRHDGYGYEIRNRELAPEVALGRVSVGLRAITKGGMAQSATTSLDADVNLEALKAALPSARPTPLRAFGEGEFDRQTDGHDPAWDDWASDPARLRDLAADLRTTTWESAHKDRLESLEGGVSFGTTWMVIASRGGRAALKKTTGVVYASVNSVHSDVRYLDHAPTEDDLPALRTLGAQTLAELPERSVTPAQFGVKSGSQLPVIVHPRLLESILRFAGSEKFLGSSLKTGMTTLLAGEKIWDPKITLFDSGVEEGLATRASCDDELTATGRTPLVEGGVFRGLVWSRRSALEAGQTSTGNGYRAPMLIEEPSEAPVRDKLSGLVMNGGTQSFEELISGIDRGIYLLACLGLHGADRARAAFSTTVCDGFAVENGEIVAALTPGTWNVAGHLFPEGTDPGMLAQVELSRERLVSGTGRLPWLRTRLGV